MPLGVSTFGWSSFVFSSAAIVVSGHQTWLPWLPVPPFPALRDVELPLRRCDAPTKVRLELNFCPYFYRNGCRAPRGTPLLFAAACSRPLHQVKVKDGINLLSNRMMRLRNLNGSVFHWVGCFTKKCMGSSRTVRVVHLIAGILLIICSLFSDGRPCHWSGEAGAGGSSIWPRCE